MLFRDPQVPLNVILVAITHSEIRETLVEAIRDHTPYFVLTASSSREALEVTREALPDLLILDYYLVPLSWIALADHLHASQKMRHLPIILLCDQRPQEVEEIERRGLLRLGRPFDLDDLLAILEAALSHPRP